MAVHQPELAHILPVKNPSATDAGCAVLLQTANLAAAGCAAAANRIAARTVKREENRALTLGRVSALSAAVNAAGAAFGARNRVASGLYKES